MKINGSPFITPNRTDSCKTDTKLLDTLKIDLDQMENKGGFFRSHEAVEKSGMLVNIAKKLARNAQKLELWIAVRPINRFAALWLKRGAQAKGLQDTHFKTADEGPGAGTIPMDQRTSKAKNGIQRGPGTLESHIKEVQLQLTEKHLNELQDGGAISSFETQKGADQTNTIAIHCPRDGELHGKFEFQGIKQKHGSYLIEYHARPESPGAITPAWEPYKVEALKQVEKFTPLTADVDLEFLAPKIDAINGTTLNYSSDEGTKKAKWAKKLPQQIREACITKGGLQGLHSKKEIYQALAYHISYRLLGELERRHFDPEKGFITSWQCQIIDRINQDLTPELYDEAGQLKPGGRQPLIRHSTEMDNPHPEGDDNIIVFAPTGSAYLTKTREHLKEIYATLRQNNYLFYENRKEVNANKVVTESTLVQTPSPTAKAAVSRTLFTDSDQPTGPQRGGFVTQSRASLNREHFANKLPMMPNLDSEGAPTPPVMQQAGRSLKEFNLGASNPPKSPNQELK